MSYPYKQKRAVVQIPGHEDITVVDISSQLSQSKIRDYDGIGIVKFTSLESFESQEVPWKDIKKSFISPPPDLMGVIYGSSCDLDTPMLTATPSQAMEFDRLARTDGISVNDILKMHSSTEAVACLTYQLIQEGPRPPLVLSYLLSGEPLNYDFWLPQPGDSRPKGVVKFLFERRPLEIPVTKGLVGVIGSLLTTQVNPSYMAHSLYHCAMHYQRGTRTLFEQGKITLEAKNNALNGLAIDKPLEKTLQKALRKGVRLLVTGYHTSIRTEKRSEERVELGMPDDSE